MVDGIPCNDLRRSRVGASPAGAHLGHPGVVVGMSVSVTSDPGKTGLPY